MRTAGHETQESIRVQTYDESCEVLDRATLCPLPIVCSLIADRRLIIESHLAPTHRSCPHVWLQFADVVVSVARKMVAALWPALFDAVGPPGDLAAGLLRAGRPVTAACCLLIVDRLQGAPGAHALALETIQVCMPPLGSHPLPSSSALLYVCCASPPLPAPEARFAPAERSCLPPPSLRSRYRLCKQ